MKHRTKYHLLSTLVDIRNEFATKRNRLQPVQAPFGRHIVLFERQVGQGSRSQGLDIRVGGFTRLI